MLIINFRKSLYLTIAFFCFFSCGNCKKDRCDVCEFTPIYATDSIVVQELSVNLVELEASLEDKIGRAGGKYVKKNAKKKEKLASNKSTLSSRCITLYNTQRQNYVERCKNRCKNSSTPDTTFYQKNVDELDTIYAIFYEQCLTEEKETEDAEEKEETEEDTTNTEEAPKIYVQVPIHLDEDELRENYKIFVNGVEAILLNDPGYFPTIKLEVKSATQKILITDGRDSCYLRKNKFTTADTATLYPDCF